MGRILVAAALCMASAGCATIVNDNTHPLKIETQTQAGELVAGANCKLTNYYGTLRVSSGDTAQVRRSNTDLQIVCSHPSNGDATARAVSRVSSSLFGNVLLGGVAGAVVDSNRGAAYTYPTWIRLVFGKALVFDRKDEKEGEPTPATESPVAGVQPQGQTVPH